jgi:hypothetical protein
MTKARSYNGKNITDITSMWKAKRRQDREGKNENRVTCRNYFTKANSKES